MLAGNPLRRNGMIRLRVPAGLPPVRVELFDLRGRRLAVLGRDLSTGDEQLLQLFGQLPAGVYLIRSQAGAQYQVQRVVVVN